MDFSERDGFNQRESEGFTKMVKRNSPNNNLFTKSISWLYLTVTNLYYGEFFNLIGQSFDLTVDHQHSRDFVNAIN